VWASSGPSRAVGRGTRRLAAAVVVTGVLTALAPVLGPTGALAAGTATRPPASAALATTQPATTQPAGAAQAPPGTIARTNQYLTDAQGRVLLAHGLMLPAGTVATDADLDAWAGAGFSAIGVTVPLTAAGAFADPRAGAGSDGAGDPGLAQAAAVVRSLTNRGLRAVLRVAPASAAASAPAAALTAAAGRLATAFRGTGGLIGYELTAAEAARAPGAANAVAAADPFHLLWRERPAPFDPTATVAVNDPAGYLTGWAGTGDGAVTAFTAAADGNQIGWLYPAQAAGQAGTVAFPAALARPYPIAVAGTLSEFGVDGTGEFTLRYNTTLAAGSRAPDGLLTAVSLPPAAFPTGYAVRVAGALATTQPGSALLCLAAEPGATAVSLTVTRAPAGRAPAPQRIAGAQACPAAAAPAGTATPAAAPHDGGETSETASALLWALPLLGAAAMALLLVVPFRRLRRMRAGSGAARDDADDADDGGGGGGGAGGGSAGRGLAEDDPGARGAPETGAGAADTLGAGAGDRADGLAPLVDLPEARPAAAGRHRAGRR